MNKGKLDSRLKRTNAQRADRQPDLDESVDDLRKWKRGVQ